MAHIRVFAFLLVMLAVLPFTFTACSNTSSEEEVYLFSFFRRNGESGLYLAYSFDGLNWRELDGGPFLVPQLGYGLMRDPSIVQGPDGTFHMVWTTGWWERIIGYAYSKDLINWSEQQAIPVMMHEPYARNSWAPELFYDPATGIFYIIWATTIPDRHSYIPTSWAERGLNHRQYYTTTKDFVTFTDTQIFFNPDDFMVIDAAVVKWQGEYWMFFKNENSYPREKNIRYTRSATMGANFPLTVSEPISGDLSAEGPSPLIVGDYLFVYFDQYGVNYPFGQYGAVRTRDGIVWENVSDQLVFPRGARHGTAFTVNRSVLDRLKALSSY